MNRAPRRLLPEALALHLLIAIAHATLALHATGIIHGQIIPEHILLDLSPSRNSPPSIRLADLAGGVDTAAHPDAVWFRGVCPHIRHIEDTILDEDDGWRFALDWAALANTLHLIMHGSPLLISLSDGNISLDLAPPPAWSVLGDTWNSWSLSWLSLAQGEVPDKLVYSVASTTLANMRDALRRETAPGGAWAGKGKKSLSFHLSSLYPEEDPSK